MTKTGHLWAVGFEDMERAEQVRTVASRLHEAHSLIVLNTAVVVRYSDGSVTLDGEPFVAATSFRGHTFASFLARLALGAPPLTAAAAGALVRGAGEAASEVGIADDFIREVEMMMNPGTSAVFVLDQEGDMAAVLQEIRGLGGKILKTNVDLERAKLIQTTLAATTARTEDQQ
jgi:uncharacterized membrane protein